MPTLRLISLIVLIYSFLFRHHTRATEPFISSSSSLSVSLFLCFLNQKYHAQDDDNLLLLFLLVPSRFFVLPTEPCDRIIDPPAD